MSGETGGLPSFWQRVDAAAPCWVWRGKRHPRGYGTYSWARGKEQLAHRYAWEALVGTIPSGRTLDHLCKNRLCVNPDHLEPVTVGENTRRGWRNNKTHCKQGHLLDDANTYVYGPGYRRCRTCNRLNKSSAREKEPTRG
jgi:hypothetical protein